MVAFFITILIIAISLKKNKAKVKLNSINTGVENTHSYIIVG